MFWKLRGKLREKNIIQSELAQKIGVSNSTLSFKLNGKTQFTLEEMRKISEILDINVNDIFFDN